MATGTNDHKPDQVARLIAGLGVLVAVGSLFVAFTSGKTTTKLTQKTITVMQQGNSLAGKNSEAAISYEGGPTSTIRRVGGIPAYVVTVSLYNQGGGLANPLTWALGVAANPKIVLKPSGTCPPPAEPPKPFSRVTVLGGEHLLTGPDRQQVIPVARLPVGVMPRRGMILYVTWKSTDGLPGGWCFNPANGSGAGTLLINGIPNTIFRKLGLSVPSGVPTGTITSGVPTGTVTVRPGPRIGTTATSSGQ
jgi:hypothetical protein